jgi:hypothetical protein
MADVRPPFIAHILKENISFLVLTFKVGDEKRRDRILSRLRFAALCLPLTDAYPSRHHPSNLGGFYLAE